MARIKNIKKHNIINEKLYNLAVEDDESYIANGIVVHNCRSMIRYVTKVDVKWDKLKPSKSLNVDQVGKLDKGNNFLNTEPKEV